MAKDGDFVNLLQEDEKIFENLRERIAGMEEEADQLRRLHENVENEIQHLEGKINDTLEKVEEAESFVGNAAHSDKLRENRRKGWQDDGDVWPDSDETWYTGDKEDFEEQDERVKNFIQQFAKRAREIEQDTKEIKQMIDDAEEKVKEEARELENLGQADAAVAKIERKLEQLNSRLPNWDNPNA
jgi:predicted  nucleic acid-binding Zn-ribbon protein